MKRVLFLLCICFLFSTSVIFALENEIPDEFLLKIFVHESVGDKIDIFEKEYYRFFENVPNFYSAEFYYEPKSSKIYLFMKLTTNDSTLYDSNFVINYTKAFGLAEEIENWDKIKAGKYKYGSNIPNLELISGELLEPEELLLYTPVYREAEYSEIFKLGLGVTSSSKDFSQLNELTEKDFSTSYNMNLLFQVNIITDPIIFIRAGYGLNIDGIKEKNQFIGLFIRTVDIYGFIKPLLGIGYCRTSFAFTNYDYKINAAKSYPALYFGLSIKHNLLDVLMKVPLAADLKTTFEQKTYEVNLNTLELEISFFFF